MADETPKPDAPRGTPGTDVPPDAAARPDAADEAARLAAEVDTLQGQIADLTDRLLRAHAEMDNIRKRADRDREDTAKYAISKFARDVVAVADNFERAVQAVPAGAAEQDAALKALVEGVSMTERELLNVFERHGVRRINPRGEAFNPASASGDDGNGECRSRAGYRARSLSVRLRDRGPRAEARHGGGVEGWTEAATPCCRRGGAPCNGGPGGVRKVTLNQLLAEFIDRAQSQPGQP